MDSGFYVLDSGFQSLTFARSHIPDSFTSGDSKKSHGLELVSTIFPIDFVISALFQYYKELKF